MIELINLNFLSVFTTLVKLLFHMTQKSSKSSMIIIAQCMNTHETLLPIDIVSLKNQLILIIQKIIFS